MAHSSNASTRVFVAHSQALVRAALLALLDEPSDITVVGDGATLDELHAGLVELRPEAAIADLEMFAPPPYRRIAELLSRHPGLRLVIVCQHEPVDDQAAAVRAGARAIVGQRTPGPHLCEAVRSVGRGLRWFDPAIERYLDYRAPAEPVSFDLANLTPRERQVAALVARGESYRQIAAELQISGHTVKNHIRHIFDKLDVNSRVELALLAADSDA